MAKRLGRKFYTAPALEVSKNVLGKFLVRKIGDKKLVGKIVEVEAYPGPEDRASHAFGMKKTARNAAEYKIGGHIYIYLVYGMYWQFNISTGKDGFPECFLIRAIEPISGFDETKEADKVKLVNGPGKLCGWLCLDKSLYGVDLCKSKDIWLEEGEDVASKDVLVGPRIGIDYAGPVWAKKPWRFWLKNNKFVSKK